MTYRKRILLAVSVASLCVFDAWLAVAHEPKGISSATEQELRATYKRLTDAENAHDIEAVRRIIWQSASALFVGKTKTAAEGNWAGFGEPTPLPITSTNCFRERS
jgi:hypothetical protein